MKRSKVISYGLTMLALLAAGLLAGCSGAPTPVVTPMPNQETVIAFAVQTLSVQMTQEAIANPSPTAVPPTNTPEPTATATEIPATPTQALPTNTLAPTATSQPAVSAKFLTASTYPENKYVYTPNERFGLAIRFMNNGTTTWGPGSKLTLSGFEGVEGDTVTVQKEATIDRAIAPGEVAEFDLWAFGSETLGQHVWYFQLSSATGGPIPGGYASFSYEAK